MSALAVAHPHPSRPRVPRLHPVPDLPAEPPVTVTISIAGAAAGRDRVLAVLRDLVAVAGPAVSVELEPVDRPAPEGTIRLDPRARTALRDSRLLELSRLEFDLLLFLAEHPGRVHTRERLLAAVWGEQTSGTRTVDVHVRRIRAKVADVPMISTVRSVGYRLATDARVRIVH
jgi:DNA-binding response OmpR family regulator